MAENLLVVDWDYFFPNPLDGGEFEGRRDWGLYDWQKAETRYHIEHAWESRAAGFLQNGLELPRAHGFEGFWDRFKFADDPILSICDSNRHAGRLRPTWADEWDDESFNSVWLYDAHHDCGYDGNYEQWEKSARFACEDWMLIHYQRSSQLHVRYPNWKVHAFGGEPEPLVPVDRQFDSEDNRPDNIAFDQVCLCRSGAWVPSWCDDQFEQFYDSFPGLTVEIGTEDDLALDRVFNREEVDSIVRQVDALRARAALDG